MLTSLLDTLLIPLQEYLQYLTGNATECQAGRCHWGGTREGDTKPPLYDEINMPLWYFKETSFRARFLHFVRAIHFHSNRGGGTGLGEINELINRGEWGWWKADCYPVSLSGHQVIVDLRHCWLSTFFPNAIRTRNTNQRGYCSLNDL